MLYAALSCLQGRPTSDAISELAALPIDGIQLTPGCVPSDENAVAAALGALTVRTHQGWTPHALRQRVWEHDTATLACVSDSVHAPRAGVRDDFFAHLEQGDYGQVAFETMYPGYCLGNSDDLEQAMSGNTPLAVDVSHLELMVEAGTLNATTLRHLLDYTHIAEIHVSRAVGHRDAHAPFTADDYLVGWAREQARGGRHVVIECYLHQLDNSERTAVFATCL
jgi:hypothetical protein